MSFLSDHVNVTITLNSVAIQRANFGTPMLVGYFPTTVFPERVRTYNSASAKTALTDDGFVTTDPIYRMAMALLGARERVEEFKVGRLALPFTQDTGFTATSSTEGDSVGFDIIDTDGTEYACYYTVGAAEDTTDVAVALKAVVDAHGLDITIATPSTAEMRMVADSAGDVFYFHSNENGDLAAETSDPGVATDLTAISVYDSEWYALLLDHESSAITDAAAGWIETERKVYLAQSADSAIPTSDTGDIATELSDDSRLRTAIIYHQAPDAPLSEYPAVAWAGVCLPQTPGSQTWAFKTLSGVSPSTYTATEMGYLEAKICNHYLTIAGASITRYGVLAAGATEFIDELRLRDWLQATVEENVFSLLQSNLKMPYDDTGLSMIEGAIRAAYVQGARNGGLSLEDWSFTALPIDEQDAADVASRTLRDVVFGGRFTGAVHSIYIEGVMEG